MNHKVSIIMPVYNAEKTLARTLEAFLYQTYDDFEAICVDDGSKDGSLEILKEYSQKDSRIKVFSQTNSGCAAARNFALEKAEGEYIMFCDADDWYEPDMIKEMVIAIEKNNADLVICDCNLENISDLNIDDLIKYHKLHQFGLKQLNEKELLGINAVVWNKIFKKKLIDKYNIKYPLKYEHDDLIFLYKYLSRSKVFYGLDKCLYNYVVGNPNSIMGKLYTKNNTKNKFDFIFAWQDLYNYISQSGEECFYSEYFIRDNFLSFRHFYSLLEDQDKVQAFEHLKNLIKNNTIMQKYKVFAQILKIKSFNDFDKFILTSDNGTFLQKIFSVKNNIGRTHKIIWVLGLKIKLRVRKDS